ncbi:sensor domain-containing diguanylate cyclase [Comamonas thiooxydans]|uniref:sensor domain-containing diguanylate cyclase n=1 Tax=Comamonas thiooxydans TaxID=363952 RepID=UPI00050E57AA|nr:diguanylate cyclase [Comamonas thiooxydans]KGG82611.1 diguanylate cyclase [Comamonas thiooxydans]MCO8250968.1 diguanylate cyclase [Comamonas thiooxydans]CUA97235.1 PAS domain S-box/diguanylate cyclase (GGDEF) domain [Comamonas thiooxydans]
MLRSMVLVAMIAVLLAGAGAAGWVAYSLRRAVMDGALPAQTKALEYAARSLAFRVEQQQKPLHSLSSVLAGHMHDSPESLQAMLKQPTSMAQQYEQLQLADGKGQLLVNLHQEQALAAEQLEEPLREVLKRSLAEGKPITQAWVRAGDAGLQLEFQNVVPVRDLQGKLQGVLGGSYRTPLSVLFSLEVASAEAGSQLLLIDRDLRPLALSSKGQWQLPPALGDAALPRGLDQAWLKTAQTGAVSEQRNNQLWSAMPLPWAQWTLLKVSNVQEWVPGVSVKMMGWLATALLILAGLLGAVLCLIAYPLTALFRSAEQASRRGLMLEVDLGSRGDNWWHGLSDHDWGEAQTLRTALQALGGGYEAHGELERDLQMQLQTLMDYAPVGLIVTHGSKVQRVGMQAARVLGYQPQEMQGLAVRDLCASDADYEDLMGRVRRALDTYGQFDSEVCLVRKDSRPIWVRIHGQSMQRMHRAWEQSGKALDGQYLVWELEDVTTQRQLREQSSWKAMHDPLTRLPNRTAFALRLKEWLREYTTPDYLESLGGANVIARSQSEPKAHGIVLYVDLDHFSQVNRQGGREVGDEVLGHIARLIESTVRPHGWVARVGGDEFAILMAGISREEGMRHAQLLCMAIQDWEGSYQGQRYMLSASIGMLLLDASYHTAASAFKGADMACYAAKRKGRNRVEVMTAAV